MKTITLVDPTDNEKKSGLVCGSGGCNKTESADKDHIKTDVLIQIETEVDLTRDKQSKKIVDDTPDIPVIVGYKGARLDTTSNDNSGGFITKPHFVPIAHPAVEYPNSNNRRTFYSVPGVRRYHNIPPNRNHNPSFVPFSGNSFNRYGPPYPSNSVYNSDNNLEIKPMPPISVGSTNDDDIYPIHIKYKNNGTRITVPYFHPSFHSHYFGENPPPQHVWYPKSSTSINNVEFKTSRPTWSPSQWYQPDHHKHTFTNDGQTTKCFCQVGSDDTVLGWYPSMRRSGTLTKIDDKLAPLN